MAALWLTRCCHGISSGSLFRSNQDILPNSTIMSEYCLKNETYDNDNGPNNELEVVHKPTRNTTVDLHLGNTK